jgi:hypothetical protein
LESFKFEKSTPNRYYYLQTLPGAIRAHPGAMKAHPGVMEAGKIPE